MTNSDSPERSEVLSCKRSQEQRESEEVVPLYYSRSTSFGFSSLLLSDEQGRKKQRTDPKRILETTGAEAKPLQAQKEMTPTLPEGVKETPAKKAKVAPPPTKEKRKASSNPDKKEKRACTTLQKSVRTNHNKDLHDCCRVAKYSMFTRSIPKLVSFYLRLW